METVINHQVLCSLIAVISLNLVLTSCDKKESSDSNSKSVTSSISASSSAGDEALEAYEKYVDSYIVFLEKSKRGTDISALQQMPAMMQQAQQASQKLTDMKSQLSSAQWNRMMNIQLKLSKAASNMAQ